MIALFIRGGREPSSTRSPLVEARHSALVLALALAACGSFNGPQTLTEEPRARFFVIGDFGVNGEEQRRLAQAMCSYANRGAPAYIVTGGDNVYGKQRPVDFRNAVREPYACLLDDGVRFRATLGNHDFEEGGGSAQIGHPLFGIPSRYYSWKFGPVSFVMLDSNTLLGDQDQIAWMRQMIREARSDPWTVVVFHHPVYSAGDVHGSEPGFEELLADEFSDAGVDVVVNGHDHNYQTAFSDGVTYMVSGGGGAKLTGCESPLTSPITKCLQEYHFLVIEAGSLHMRITAIDQRGRQLDVVVPLRND